MKTIKKASLLFASLALVLGAGLVGNSDTKEVKAEATKITLSSAKTVSNLDLTITFAKGSGSTAPTWYPAGLRLYAKNTITVKSKEKKITNFTFDWEKQGTNDFASATANVGDYSHPTATGQGIWIGSSDSITFTLGSSGQLQLNTLSYELEASSSPSDPMTGITIENDFKTKSYKQNSQWDVDGLVVKAVYESGNKKELANSDVTWTFDKKPSDFEPGTGYSITVTALYKTASVNKTIEGIEIIESPRVYSFNSMKDFDTWESGYVQHVDYLTYPGLKIVLEKANKNSQTITDVPVTKGNDVEIIVTDNTTLSVAAFTFKQWTDKTQTVKLYTSTDAGQTYSSYPLVSSSNFTIPETTLPENTNALKITFSSQKNQVGLVDFQLSKVKDTVENFVSNWKTFRTNGGNDGICYYLTETNREALEIMLARHDAFDVSDKTTIDATTDVEGVTIGETITYLKNVLAGSTKTSGEYGINSGVVITSNNSYDKTSLIALFAILGIVTISGYYIIEKKKFSK